MIHFQSPVFLTMDVASAASIFLYWTDISSHPVSVISTFLAGCWYAFCLYEAIEKRWKK